MRSLRRTGLVLALALAAAARLAGQSPLFVLDLQGTALDEFPSAVKALNGTMTTVDMNGQRMLRASSPSEFLITLPQNLPAAFTVILDVIPKGCCAPEDIMLEGTPTMNRGVASVQLTWQPAHIMAVGGGGEMYQSDMPADLAASTPGNLTQLVWEFNGTKINLYTNGRRLYTLDKQFARGRVLRVWLGGADEGLNAVHLASLSILDGAVARSVIAGINSSTSRMTGAPSGSTSTITSVGGSSPTAIRTPATSPGTGRVNPASPAGVTAPRSAGTTGSSAVTLLTQPPPITNLTATVGPAADGACVFSWCPDWLQANGACVFAWCPDWNGNGACITSWCPDWRPGTSARQVTWSWTLPTGVATVLVTFDLVAPDPVTGRLTTTRVSGNPAVLPSGSSIAVVVGTTLQTCVAAQVDPADPSKLLGAACNTVTVGSAGSGTASSSQALTGSGTTTTMSPTVTQGTAGPEVQWSPLRGATGYTVKRWKSNDLTCCNNSSAPQQALSPWQDAALTVAGTYVYEVTASFPTSSVVEQAQFIVLATPIGTPQTPSSPTPPTAVPVSPTGTSTTTPTASTTPVVSAPLAAQTGTPVRTSSAPPPGSPAAAALAPTGPPPTNIAVTGTPVNAKLNWGSGISGMRGVTYKVDRWLESNPSCCAAQSTTLSFPAWTDEGVQWSGTYVFQVTEFYPDGTWGQATYRWVRPDPVNPANFRAASVSAGFVALRWDAVPNASWYELSGPGLGYPTFAATSGAFNVHNLAPGTYTWRVGTFYSSPNAPGPVSGPASAFPSVTVTVP